MKHLPLLLLLGGLLSASAARSADPVRYVDAATLTVIGKALPTEQPYNRIDTTAAESIFFILPFTILPSAVWLLFFSPCIDWQDIQCKLGVKMVRKEIIYVTKEDIQMPGLWVRDRSI